MKKVLLATALLCAGAIAASAENGVSTGLDPTCLNPVALAFDDGPALPADTFETGEIEMAALAQDVDSTIVNHPDTSADGAYLVLAGMTDPETSGAVDMLYPGVFASAETKNTNSTLFGLGLTANVIAAATSLTSGAPQAS